MSKLKFRPPKEPFKLKLRQLSGPYRNKCGRAENSILLIWRSYFVCFALRLGGFHPRGRLVCGRCARNTARRELPDHHDGRGTCSRLMGREGVLSTEFFSQNLDYWAGGFCAVCFGGAGGYFAGHGVDAGAAWGLFALGGYWLAGVAAYADFWLDFYFA